MTTPIPESQLTPADCAPFLGRLLLATHDGDEQAFMAALEDASAHGVTVVALLILLTQALASRMDADGPGWTHEVRLGLLEVADNDTHGTGQE